MSRPGLSRRANALGRPPFRAARRRVWAELDLPHRRPETGLSKTTSFSEECARVDSNHHGEISPQGPQPDPPIPCVFAGVCIAHFAGFRGRVGRVGRPGFCQRFVMVPAVSEAKDGCANRRGSDGVYR
jgi:hypothetical protein